jgi:hypothetical protein
VGEHEEVIVLEDKRVARRDAGGRWREVDTGRFIAKEHVSNSKSLMAGGGQGGKVGEGKRTLRDFVLEAVRHQGHEVETPEEAFGKLIGVQAEIALNKDHGSRATAATKLVAQATGILGESEDPAGETKKDGRRVLGRELAVALLGLIEEEKGRRAGGLEVE